MGSEDIQKYTFEKELLTIGDNLLYNLGIQQRAAEKRKDLTFVTEKFDELAEHWSTILPEEG